MEGDQITDQNGQPVDANGQPLEPESRRDALASALNTDTSGSQPAPGAASSEPGTGTGTGEGGDEQPLEPPTGWSAEDREEFRGATRKQQEFLLRTYRGMESAHTKRSQEVAPFRRVVQEFEPYLQRLGTTADRYFRALGDFEHTMRTGTNEERIDALFRFAQRYNVDFTNGNGDGRRRRSPQDDPFGVDAQVDEHVRPLRRENSDLRRRLDDREEREMQRQAEEAATAVREFESAKGEDGKPLHPYFQEVRIEMAEEAQALLDRGITPDLSKLYERATWANPDVRAKILKDQEHAARAKVNGDRIQAQKDARATGGLAGGGGGGAAQPKSRLDLLKEGVRAMRDA